MNASATKQGFMFRHRYWIMTAAILLFLPPLSLLFQFTQDSSFCGSWCPRMFFVWRKGITAGEYFLGYARGYMGVILVLGILASTFFFGRYWCSHLCPVGGAMELSSKVWPRFLKLNFSTVPAPSFRYGYLFMYFALSALGIGSLCCNYCNFATLPRLFGAAFVKADMAYFFRTAGLINLGLVVVLGVASKGGRGYCNLICPVGALDSLSNRLGLRFGMRMRVDAGRCNACGACAKKCPVWAIDINKVTDPAADIDSLSCVPCGECKKVCPKEAISYGRDSQ